MKQNPRTAADYAPGFSRLVRQTCLEVATRLGDFQDCICVVGGIVPSLIIPPATLREGESEHVGTVDLDLGFSIAVLHEELYEEIARRLIGAGFSPDQNEAGNPTAQRWCSAQGVTVDFLMPPVGPDDRGGRLRHLEHDLAAFITPGLDLAFRDSDIVTLDDRLPTGARARRRIRVCGPAAFVVLKALAFDKRGKPKDAYDLYYVLRHHELGADGMGERIAGFMDHPQAREALDILRRDFTDAGHVGPVRVAEFLGGRNVEIEADAAGFVRQLLGAV